MDLFSLKPGTKRAKAKRVGRGGKRGTTSGGGTKGQKSRAGASVRPGFRGGDNRIWQLFPKQRGASKKHGSKRVHHKHRFFSVSNAKPFPVNLGDLVPFKEGDTVSPQTLSEKGLVGTGMKVKILGGGTLGKRLSFKELQVSAGARSAIEKAGGTIE